MYGQLNDPPVTAAAARELVFEAVRGAAGWGAGSKCGCKITKAAVLFSRVRGGGFAETRERGGGGPPV